jgi:hypothetical protein
MKHLITLCCVALLSVPLIPAYGQDRPTMRLNSASMPTNSDDAETSNTAIDVRLFLIF